ncbi:MAG: hypothetical protein LBQ41_01305 [Candidatus Ancillula sp.]|jgi:hypothetical protein|nr:hypothetical protein [Candidatus Ancillula sp.]
MALAFGIVKYVLAVIFQRKGPRDLEDCCIGVVRERILQLREQYCNRVSSVKVASITKGIFVGNTFFLTVFFEVGDTNMTYFFDFEKMGKRLLLVSLQSLEEATREQHKRLGIESNRQVREPVSKR